MSNNSDASSSVKFLLFNLTGIVVLSTGSLNIAYNLPFPAPSSTVVK